MLNVRNASAATTPYVYEREVAQGFVIVVASLGVVVIFSMIQFFRSRIETRYPWMEYYFTEHMLKMQSTDINTHL